MSKTVYGNLAVKPEYTPVKRERVVHTRKVTIRHGLPIKEKLSYLLLVVVFVAISGILLSKYALLAETNYKVQAVKAKITNVQKEIDLLQIEVARLSSPDRIETVAQEMGLTQREGNVKTVRIASLPVEKTIEKSTENNGD